MKIGLSFVSLAVLAMSSFAQASINASGYASIGEVVRLKGCGGTMSLNSGANADQVNVVFKNIKLCSNFDIIAADSSYIGDYRAKKLKGPQNKRGGSFTIPSDLIGYGVNTVTVQLHSNSGLHSDTVTVVYNKRFSVSVNESPVELPSCGGTISVTNGASDNKIYMNFNGVANCSNFDLVGDDGMAVSDYKAKKLVGANGDKFRSFEIPADNIHAGTNTLTATVYSNSKSHQDIVNVTYTAGYAIE